MMLDPLLTNIFSMGLPLSYQIKKKWEREIPYGLYFKIWLITVWRRNTNRKFNHLSFSFYFPFWLPPEIREKFYLCYCTEFPFQPLILLIFSLHLLFQEEFALIMLFIYCLSWASKCFTELKYKNYFAHHWNPATTGIGCGKYYNCTINPIQ